jgi:hypothetical protein
MDLCASIKVFEDRRQSYFEPYINLRVKHIDYSFDLSHQSPNCNAKDCHEYTNQV